MDLLEREGFVRDQMRQLEALEPASRRVSIVLGAALPWEQGRPEQLANAAVVLAGGKRVATRAKSLLPSYDVFDEKRYFVRAEKREPVRIAEGSGFRSIGLAICEDTWVSRIPYDVNPAEELVRAGAEIILNPSASPWHVGKALARRDMLTQLARANQVPLVFVNQVGGNDELVFDGGSFACDAQGRVLQQLPLFKPAFAVVELPFPAAGDTAPTHHKALALERAAELEAGLVLGIRDYFEKQNLPPGAVIGLSGGIDSAVTAHLAVEALGAERVLGVAMPGPFSSQHSVEDAHALGEMLGIEVREVDITPVFESYRSIFASLFGEQDDYGLTQQNIQSRIRGAILMAASNQEGRLVLATGNKSELSLGYCTLYGDTVGGLAVLGDVYKRDVYAIAKHANREKPRIPGSTMEKPPSAELAPDQLDTDDLPDYDVLDAVLEQCIEGGMGASGVKPPPGCRPEVAEEIVRRLDRNEYKRRQAPLVLRTSPKAFGSGRRLPIVHRYRS
jgi:NAD+ synthetase